MEITSRKPKKIIDYRITGCTFALIKKIRSITLSFGTVTVRIGSKTLSSSAVINSSHNILRPALTHRMRSSARNSHPKMTRRRDTPLGSRISRQKLRS